MLDGESVHECKGLISPVENPSPHHMREDWPNTCRHPRSNTQSVCENSYRQDGIAASAATHHARALLLGGWLKASADTCFAYPKKIVIFGTRPTIRPVDISLASVMSLLWERAQWHGSNCALILCVVCVFCRDDRLRSLAKFYPLFERPKRIEGVGSRSAAAVVHPGLTKATAIRSRR